MTGNGGVPIHDDHLYLVVCGWKADQKCMATIIRCYREHADFRSKELKKRVPGSNSSSGSRLAMMWSWILLTKLGLLT